MEVLQQNLVKDNPQAGFWVGGIVRAHFGDMTDQFGFNRNDDFAVRNDILRHLCFHLVAGLELLGCQGLGQFHQHVRAFALCVRRDRSGQRHFSFCRHGRLNWTLSVR